MAYSQEKKQNRLILSAVIFIPVIAILIFAKIKSKGFNILWKYFAWAKETVAVFVFGMIRVYLYKENESFIMSLIPGMFYVFITYTYILNAKIGFNLNYNLSNILGIVLP